MTPSLIDLVKLKSSLPRSPSVQLIGFEGKLYVLQKPTFTVPKFIEPSWGEVPRAFRNVRPIHSRKRVSPCAMKRRAMIMKERADYAKRADDLMFRVMSVMESKIMATGKEFAIMGAF